MVNGNARCYNGCVLVCIFLAWVSCCVAFGNDLHAVDFSIAYGDAYSYSYGVVSTIYFYTDGVQSDSYSDFFYYTDCSSSLCNACASGGNGVNTGASIAFIAALVCMCLTLARISGSCATIERSMTAQKMATAEWWLAIVVMVLLAVAIGSWSDCYNKTIDTYYDYSGASIRATGWAFLISTMIFTFIAFILLTTIKRTPSMLRWSGIAPGETNSAPVVNAVVFNNNPQPVVMAQQVPGGYVQQPQYYQGQPGGQPPMYPGGQPQQQYQTGGYVPQQGGQQPVYMAQGQPMYQPQGQPMYAPQGQQPMYAQQQPIYNAQPGQQPIYTPGGPTYAQQPQGTTNGPPTY